MPSSYLLVFAGAGPQRTVLLASKNIIGYEPMANNSSAQPLGPTVDTFLTEADLARFSAPTRPCRKSHQHPSNGRGCLQPRTRPSPRLRSPRRRCLPSPRPRLVWLLAASV
jgi:hypothetical protein